MFPPHRLDSPPPPRTLAYHRPRPWSPDPYDPLPPMSSLQNRNNVHDDLYDSSVPLARQRREASEASIEALDLADYARTLRTQQPGDQYPALQQDRYPPLSPPTQDNFPSFAPGSFIPEARVSRDSLSPPSLVSRGPTLSSSGSHSTSRGGRRPFSLPTPNSSNYALHSSSSRSQYPQPRIVEPRPTYPGTDRSEIDIAQFPAWSRSWYQSANRVNPHSPPPIDDLYTAIPPSNLAPGNTKKNIFDPTYVHYDQDYYPGTDPSALSDPVFAPPSSMGHDSTRELLPWSQADNSASVDPVTKEERMRMLEREFGPNSGKGKNRSNGDFVDEEGRPLIGTVDEKGNLVTQGPKKRTAVRVLQILFALGAGLPAIYAAVAIKPNPPAPPANKPPAFALYILSILTFLALLYLFVFQPCCCNPRRKNKTLMDNPLAGGMMVLPVPGASGGKKKRKNNGKKSKNGAGGGGVGGADGDVQVNLIVDPNVFSGNRNDEDDSDDDSDGQLDDGMPGGYYGSRGKQKGKARGRRNKRRSVFAGLAMEAEWKKARAWAKKIAFFDVVGLVIWGAVFVLVLIGKRFPSGGFDGWCNAYNVSSACACLLCVAFGISIFFDVKDLHTSKVSPRTRT